VEDQEICPNKEKKGVSWGKVIFVRVSGGEKGRTIGDYWGGRAQPNPTFEAHIFTGYPRDRKGGLSVQKIRKSLEVNPGGGRKGKGEREGIIRRRSPNV